MKGQSGQSLVELALSIVLLMLLLAGAVEFGLAFFQQVQLRDAAQEGALFGSIYPNEDVSLRAKSSSSSPLDMLNDPGVTIDVSFVDLNGDPKVCTGDQIVVKATYQHKIFMPFLPQILGRSILPVSATAVNTIFNPEC